MIQVGQTIGNYRITAKLGEGGMGIVYLAEHPVIGKKVALKAIHPELSRNAEVVSRFMTEAKSVNQIGNEHIVDITDFGTTTDGEFYFIMEFLQGEALADRLKRERLLPPARALGIGAQVADALGASHDHGIIHRDLKPENIFLLNRASNPDFVKVLDFGLAKLTTGGEKISHKTRTGSVMGTPYYMAPEQCEGRANIDHRADIYSLGVILFEMVTGKVPFGGEGYGEIIVKHITIPPPSPRSINPGLSEAVEAIVLRALAKPREHRFQSMVEFREALLDPERHLAGRPLAGGAHAEGYAMTVGAMPAARAEGGSGAMPSGSLRPSAMAADDSRHGGPQPSTFRSSVGELADDEAPPRSRAPLMVAVALALLAGGGGGWAYLRGRPTPPAATTAADQPPPPRAVAAAAAQPAHPASVKVSVSSTPAGARVFRRDSGAQLAVTPATIDLPYGDGEIELVVRKDGFADAALGITPNQERAAGVDLKAAAPTAGAATTGAAEPRRKAGSSGSRKKAKGNKTNDPDDLLSPDWAR